MNKTKRILIIESNKKLAQFVSLELNQEGYRTVIIHDGRRGLGEALSKDYDLILLDIMLPELGGFEVIRRLRREKSTPIIIMTECDSIMDRIAGLDIGADDYIIKPFTIEEFLARIRSLFRRVQKHLDTEKNENIAFRDLIIDEINRVVYRDKNIISLTSREFSLLLALVKNSGNVVTREYLIHKVWGYEENCETNIVDVYIRYLRNKIDMGGEKNYIQTIRGIGYVVYNHEIVSKSE